MSDGKPTPNKPKRNSKNSSATVLKAGTSTSGVPTSGQIEKNRKNDEPVRNSPEGDLTEEDDELNEDNGNKDIKDEQNIVQTKFSKKDVLNKSQQQEEKASAPKTSAFPPKRYIFGFLVFVGAALFIWPNNNSDTPSNSEDWRSNIDPNGHLSTSQRVMIFASLKPILDRASMNQDEGVSTLLILSPDEEVTAKLARCLLLKVNKPTNNKQISTEIDLKSHSGGKLALDSKLRKLLNTSDTIRAVLLRRIDNIPSDVELNQLRLLFAYCDGENPVVPHRLIIMTATSDSKSESDLRENFKNRLPDEHDFIDALMSRISGHTLYLEKDQKSIC